MSKTHLAHKITLDPTKAQIEYFKRAAGTARFVYNWALAEWNRQYAAGLKPTAYKLKKYFNSIKYTEFPWLKDIHRDCHSQPFPNLEKSWKQFFRAFKAGKEAHRPKFKKKSQSIDSFYLANDVFKIKSDYAILPKIGKIKLKEPLRFTGKILSATVSRTANKWYISISVEIPDHLVKKQRESDNTIGIDLGINSAVTFSSGEKFNAPKPLKKNTRLLKIRKRRASRKLKKKGKILKGTKFQKSNNYIKAQLKISILEARIARQRKDFIHKITSKICSENQVIVLEDLNVSGMLKNHKIARAIQDIGFYEIRRQLEYKKEIWGNTLILADRFYPSSKLCSNCSNKNEDLTLKDRTWYCSHCGVTHDRDLNAAKNLEKLSKIINLPEAIGKVTPARYDSVCKKNQSRN